MGKHVAREMKIATQACVATPTERRRVRGRPQRSPAMLGRRELWLASPGLERARCPGCCASSGRWPAPPVWGRSSPRDVSPQTPRQAALAAAENSHSAKQPGRKPGERTWPSGKLHAHWRDRRPLHRRWPDPVERSPSADQRPGPGGTRKSRAAGRHAQNPTPGIAPDGTRRPHCPARVARPATNRRPAKILRRSLPAHSCRRERRALLKPAEWQRETTIVRRDRRNGSPSRDNLLPIPTGRNKNHHKVFAVSQPDRKSTRLNSSHVRISYAVFCLKKKKKKYNDYTQRL